MSPVQNVTHVPVHSPTPCLYLNVKDTASRTALLSFIAQLSLLLSSYRVGNRAAFSDSRSNFHTRVGYRTNVCRRRLASDLARASDSSTPAQGALDDHHDLPPGSPSDKWNFNQAQVALTALISWPIAQTKPASSRASAATTMVGFLPRATIVR